LGRKTTVVYDGSATDNTVNLGEGAQVMEVYGGVGAPGGGDVFSGNTLNVNAATARVSTAVANFQTINFGFSGTSTLTTIETTPSGSSASGVTINTGAHDLTLANTTITGSGSLTKAGTGTLTLSTANALAHSGPLTVSGGTLALAGEYTQAGTLTIGATDSASYGRLAVNGPATLSDGLHVDVRGTNFADGDSLSDVLTAAGGVAGTFSRVTDNSALFDFSAVYAANSVSLGVARGAVSAAQAVASSGNALAGGAARALDHAFASNPNGALASLFVPLTDARQVSDAVSQTLPLLAGNGTQVTTNTMNNIGAAVAARQHLAMGGASGVSTGSAPREWALWAKPFNTRIEQSPKDGDPGYEANTTGILIGADAAFGESVHAGVAFAYATSDSDSKSSVAPQSMETRLYELIGYGSYAFGEGTIATWRGVFGAAENQGARTINFSAVGEADSDFDSLIAGFGAGVEHSFALSPRTTLSPYANAVYNWVRNDSYRETSDSAGISPLLLAVDAQESQSLVPELGMRLDFRPNAAWGLSAHLAEGYELLDRRSSLTARYAGVSGVSFTTKGAEESAWITRCGLALTYFMDDISLRAGYDLETRDGYTNQTFSAVLRAAF
jgi:outer membrane autotransporter protein